MDGNISRQKIWDFYVFPRKPIKQVLILFLQMMLPMPMPTTTTIIMASDKYNDNDDNLTKI